MKGFRLLLLTFLLLLTPQLNYAEPHSLDDFFPSYPFRYTIDLLVKKEPVKYAVTDGVPKEEHYRFPGYFQAWFNNILTHLQEPNTPQKEELKDFLDIIEFAASQEAYEYVEAERDDYKTINTADIQFFFAETHFPYGLHPHCPRGAAACFNENRKTIHLPYNVSQSDFNHLALHEIGHSLRLEDTYDGQFPIKAGRYGSGVKDSIMHNSHTLTCDDADAIVNALWLTRKHFYTNQPDLEFSSFCNRNVKFRNAQQMGRPPLTIDKDGERMVYSYCKNGEVKTTTYLNPSNGKKFYKFTEEKPDCDGQLPRLHSVKPEEGISYTIKDFNTGEVLKENKANTLLTHTTYMALPYSDGLTLSISEHKNGIPAYLAITNENNLLIYMLAYLDNGYNIVYDFRLSGERAVRNFHGVLFIYNRENPSKSYVYIDPRYDTEETKNNPLRQMLDKYYNRLVKSHNIPLPAWGDFGAKSKKDYLAEAKAWEEYLLNQVPLLKSSSAKALVGEIKPLKEDLNLKISLSGLEHINPSSKKK